VTTTRQRLRADLLGLFGWRLLLLLLPALFAVLQLASFAAANYAANFHGALEKAPVFATRWATWDAQHYLFIAEHGYIAGHVSSAFWPLWPLLIGFATRATGAPALAAALALANLLAIGAAIGLWHLVRARCAEDDRRTADWTVAFLLAFPSAFFLALPYSEALFLALAIALFLALDRRRYGWAALAACALPLARPVGLFILLPLLAFARREIRRPPDATGRVAPRALLSLLLLAPVAGATAYFAIHLLTTGEALGAFAVRGRFVSGQSLGQLLDLAGFLRAAVTVDALHSVTGSLLDRVLFLLAVAALPWLYRRDRILFWYALPMTLVPAFSLRLMAFNRFALVLFPVFWAAASAALAPGRAILRWSLLALSVGLQFWLYFRHSLNLWAG
jgi:hypothetical protein